jgi:hypothetical protein
MIRTRILLFLAAVAMLAGAVTPVWAEPTTITVRVIAKGALFIGTGMGGVSITIRDTLTGALLAHGVTQGTTGDPAKILSTTRKRGEGIATPDAAHFTATVDITEPRLVEISADGPLGHRQATASASITQWLLPGQSLTGDGLILELPGLVVDVLAPVAQKVFEKPPGKVRIEANITMMCGCPIAPGAQFWDANQMHVAALVKHNGQPVATTTLRYAGKPSRFGGTIEITQLGMYEIVVYAHDRQGGNIGVDTTTLEVGE